MSKRGGAGWAGAVSTFFGIGRLKPGPGTMAAAATMLLWWAGARYVFAPSRLTFIAVALAIMVTLIGGVAASRYSRSTGKKDPCEVVIDEVAGQMIAMIAAPITWPALIASFVLFRIFDILKPPPARQLEALPGGIGIMADDVMAGVYAWLATQAVLWTGILR